MLGIVKKAAISLAVIGLVLVSSGPGVQSQPFYGTSAHPFVPWSKFNLRISGAGSLPLFSTESSAANVAMARFLGAGVTADLYADGVPIYSDVNAATPRYQVTCTEPWGTCDFAGQAVPVPPDATPSSGSDGNMEIVDPYTGLVYSFWQARRSPSGGWTTSWGAIERVDGRANIDIHGNPANTGSGLSPIAGAVTLDDLASGQIDHALAFSSSITCSSFVDPATNSDGTTPGPNCLPEGSRVQLDPNVNLATIPGITPIELTVGRALQSYGAICRDTGGAPMAIQFQEPKDGYNPYPSLGAPWDYWNMPHLPWGALRIVTG